MRQSNEEIRDEFAKEAMKIILKNDIEAKSFIGKAITKEYIQHLGKASYALADAMMEARKK